MSRSMTANGIRKARIKQDGIAMLYALFVEAGEIIEIRPSTTAPSDKVIGIYRGLEIAFPRESLDFLTSS